MTGQLVSFAFSPHHRREGQIQITCDILSYYDQIEFHISQLLKKTLFYSQQEQEEEEELQDVAEDSREREILLELLMYLDSRVDWLHLGHLFSTADLYSALTLELDQLEPKERSVLMQQIQAALKKDTKV